MAEFSEPLKRWTPEFVPSILRGELTLEEANLWCGREGQPYEACWRRLGGRATLKGILGAMHFKLLITFDYGRLPPKVSEIRVGDRCTGTALVEAHLPTGESLLYFREKLELRAEAKEFVTFPFGTYECFKIRIDVLGGYRYHWVSTDLLLTVKWEDHGALYEGTETWVLQEIEYEK